MTTLSKETEFTQEGQAITINQMALTSLSSLFSSIIGPYGSYKLLISPSANIKITSDGNTILNDMQITHPTAMLIKNGANQLYSLTGDGISSYILICAEIFNGGYFYFKNGTEISDIIEGLNMGMQHIVSFLERNKVQLNKDSMKNLISSILSTKIRESMVNLISPLIINSFDNLVQNKTYDINMVEVIKMEGGDAFESRFIEGLVLDHGNRHQNMPTELENAVIITSNISLEYEKTEVNSNFYYSDAEKREQMAFSERRYFENRAKKIADFAEKLKAENKTVFFITTKGIDPFSLEVLANGGVLGLRRCKRRNLERILKMCGGNLISDLKDLSVENCGFAKNIYLKEKDGEKFTFIEGVKNSGSCSILVKGGNRFELERTVSIIKTALKTLSICLSSPFYIKGGPTLYYKLSRSLNDFKRNVDVKKTVGIEILKTAFLNLSRILLKNGNKNSEEELAKFDRNIFTTDNITDSFIITLKVITTAIHISSTLLSINEIIRAGKTLKDEKKE